MMKTRQCILYLISSLFYLQCAFAQIPTDLPPTERIQTALQLADAYQRSGQTQRAIDLLNQVNDTLPNELEARLLSRLATLYIVERRFNLAESLAERSVELAEQEPRLLAKALNNQGNVLMLRHRYGEALEAYQDSYKLAKQQANHLLSVQTLINQAQVFIAWQSYPDAAVVLQRAFPTLQSLPNDEAKILQLLTLGRLASRTQAVELAYQAYRQAQQLAEQSNLDRLQNYAIGYLGELYAQQNRDREAEQLFRQAQFTAQHSSKADLLYRWQWQMARLFVQRGEVEKGLFAYRQAVQTVQPIRFALDTAYRPEHLNEGIRELYFELADLLLQQAEQSGDAEHRDQLLIEARDTLELLKAAELQDYFQDDCVANASQRAIDIDQLSANTAVLYPIILQDRLVLLLSLPDGLEKFVVPVEARDLDRIVNRFRSNLVNRSNYRFFREAQRLYEWLITPLESQLAEQDIETLIIVPDGSLRTIPLAALYDGDQFLLQRFALAVTPGLSLTNPRRLPLQQQPQVLLNGLSKAVQDFSPLPNVPREIDNLSSLFRNVQVLEDQDFVLENVESRLRDTAFSVVHLATHGQFDADPQNTFLLTYDSKLTMDRLEQLLNFTQAREEPVELLTLSACQTAVGDDRAALGLAGIAVKAGARSAVASLWFVDDSATAELMSRFYSNLLEQRLSRAEALRQAQLALLEQRRYQHPAFWSAFLLIGSWL